VVRLFSIKRIFLSSALGFLLPLGYAFMLSLASDYTGITAPEFMVMPFGWPHPLWIFLMGRQPSESDLMHGLLFMAACNIVFYGSFVYAGLSMLPVFRGKRADYKQPPPPEQHSSKID
jgi:hypothetical protein